MSDRISGKLGEVFIAQQAVTPVSIDVTSSTNLIAFLFEWTLEFEIELEECSIKGAIGDDFSIGGFSGMITAQRFAQDQFKDADSSLNGLSGGALDEANTAG